MPDYGEVTAAILLAHYLGALFRVIEAQETVTTPRITEWQPQRDTYYELWIVMAQGRYFVGIWYNKFHPAKTYHIERWLRGTTSASAI